MIRVLHAVGKLHRAGQETLLMNVYQAIDRNQVQFDFLVHTQETCDYDELAERLGARIYRVQKIQRGVLRYIRSISAIVRENGFDVVHLNTAHSAGAFVLLAAKLGGAQVRVAHAHNDRAELPWLHYLLRPMLRRYATRRVACSEQAGRWMFGPRADFCVFKNAIDTERFRFSEATRTRKRVELGLGDCLTLGHVGRFTRQKNHPFLLRLFAEVLRRDAEARLVLVGDGEDMDATRALAQSLGVAERVLFLGSRPDVNELMQAMDVFVFPSLYEGFGNVVIEAQATGLPCVVADTLSRETDATERVCYLPLDRGLEPWVDAVLSAHAEHREQAASQVADAGFDAGRVALEYANLYRQAVAALPAREGTPS